VAGTGLEPVGAGGRRVQAQNRGGGVTARWGLGTVPGGAGQKWFKLFQKFNLFQKHSNFFQILIDPNLTFPASNI
jgi:hypothetical protein